MMSQKTAIIGCIIGTAIGDAIGLPVEGLSKRRQSFMYPEIREHHLLQNTAHWQLRSPLILPVKIAMFPRNNIIAF
jgi:hypothetical protein